MIKTYTNEATLFGVIALVVVSWQAWLIHSLTSVSTIRTQVEVQEEQNYHVIDASYIDHTGKYDDCVEYADSYKNHHEYIVVSSKEL